MGRYAYVAPFLLLVPAFLAMVEGGPWTWFLPVFTFVVLPLAEQFDRGSTRNYAPEEEAARLADPFYDRLLYAMVPGQWALLLVYLARMSAGDFTPAETAGAVLTMGIACATYGLNVAHELGHRRDRREQALAKALLLTSLYVHFFVEHNRGHHRRVATPEDPASARRGESVYAFWLRSIPGGWRSAWRLENERMAREGRPWWSWRNEMVRGSVLQLGWLGVVLAIFGPVGLVAAVGAAAVGILLLETVNYLEHYGLQRARTPEGAWERVRPEHSWNSNRMGGRIFLFDLTRHSDHHAHATRKYQVLRHHDDAPELPAGYPAMILAALVPPLFFAVVHPVLDRWTGRMVRAAPVA